MEKDALTSELKGQRTLATVVFTDCVGFSARMSVDEDHTLDLIRRDLKLMKRLCEEFEGRVLKSTGDGLLMCFISAVKAVEYAVEVQKQLVEKSSKLSANDALRHRIGIHLADIFINETDVMGNGVNIAARLQTLADPGGICISQTVYDVVKAGLQVGTRYLGPKELKNIREVVPVYKILLAPEPELTDLYLDVIRNLEQNPNLVRIKKLLFYACKSTWESSQNIVDSFPLEALINELLEVASTPDRLKSFLDSAVRTLSKPAEYALVATDILKEVSRLYEKPPQQISTPPIDLSQTLASPPPSPADLRLMYEQIAQELEQTGNLLRLKKLIYYVCRKRWENDQNRLNCVSLPDLIAELHQLAPTLEQVSTTLNEFVQTLSKQAEYTLVANIVTGKLQRLYPNRQWERSPSQSEVTPPPKSSVPMPDLSPAAAAVQPETRLRSSSPTRPQVNYIEISSTLKRLPELPRLKKLMLYASRQQWESDAAKLEQLPLEPLIQELHQQNASQEHLEQALNGVVKLLNKRDEYAAIARIIFSHFRQLYADSPEVSPEVLPAAVSAPPPPDAGPAAIVSNPIPSALSPPVNPQSAPPRPPSPLPSSSLPSFFDYRLGIMKAANPLKTKILLFSALQADFSEADPDWLNLKAADLDSLMRQLCKTCKTYTDMEELLYGAARKFREREDSLQTATTVIKCLRPFYLYGGSLATLNSSTEDTQISLDEFEETTLEFASSNAEDELTCQMLVSDASLTQVSQSEQQNGSTRLLTAIEPPDHQVTHFRLHSEMEPLKTAIEPAPSTSNLHQTRSNDGSISDQTHLHPPTNQGATG